VICAMCQAGDVVTTMIDRDGLDVRVHLVDAGSKGWRGQWVAVPCRVGASVVNPGAGDNR
jgi:hypothetical protein